MADALSRERLIAAAIRLIDEKGMEALSMRSLAKSVGRDASSLYNHVTNRAHLIELVTAQVMRQIDVRSIFLLPWSDAIRSWAHSYLDVFVHHPNLIRELPTAPVRDRSSLEMYEVVLSSLVGNGWRLVDAIAVIRLVEAYVFGSALDMIAMQGDSPVRLEDVPVELRHVQAALRAHAMEEITTKHAFDFGLEVLIRGLEERREASSGAGSSPG